MSEQIEKEDRPISNDLRNGFHHNLVHKDFWKFLGIGWQGRFYHQCVLAFGINQLPTFSIVLHPVVRYFRQNVHRNILFVDDFLFMIREWLSAQQKKFAIYTLDNLGWDMNYDKSQLEDKTKCAFIRVQHILQGKTGPQLHTFAKKDAQVKKAYKVVSKNSVKAKIPSKNWGQMHCDDACSITSKIIALQFALHIVFQVNMGVRSRDS